MGERPSAAARRMWCDIAAHGHLPALRCAIDSFGSDRLLLGTDYPYQRADVFRRAFDYVAGVRGRRGVGRGAGRGHPGRQRPRAARGRLRPEAWRDG